MAALIYRDERIGLGNDDRLELACHAFLKKLAMLPCPFLPAVLPFAELVGLAGTGLSFFGSGSSSENDSHTASSLVTMIGKVSVMCSTS